MKKMGISMLMMFALVTFGAVQAQAASSANINVTVTITIGALDVSVSPTSWAIGSVSESSTTSTGPDFFTATNDRNASEDLTLKVAASGDWAHGTSPGANQFAMKFSITGASPMWSVITPTTGVSLVSGLGSGNSQNFDLQLLSPTSTNVGGVQQSIGVTVEAS